MPIQAFGPKLIESDSKAEIRLKGICLQDPIWARLAPGPRLVPHGPLALEVARSWGANAVRVPFHPITIRFAGNGEWQLGLEAVAQELDWILARAQELNLLVIVDFHSIGFPAALSPDAFFEFDEDPFRDLYRTNQEEIETFWSYVARRFHRHPSIAGFELFNEATRETAFGSASDWKAHASWTEGLIRDVIRPVAPQQLLIVGGLHFGYDLEFVHEYAVRDHNIAYASHPYPHHSQAKTWDRAFGRTSENHPVILSEIGFSHEGFFSRDHHRGFRDWELEIRSFADARQLSFFAWNFSHSWEPCLLKSSEPPFEPNEAGVFFQEWLRSQS
jgi:endoglucanase